MINIPAVILAAGKGQRLGEYTLDQPKPMTTIVDEISIIQNLIETLVKHKFKQIVLVVGYLSNVLKDHIRKIETNESELIFINNDIYDNTNNIYSLWLAKQYLGKGFYLFEADIFFEPKLLKQLIYNENENIIVADQYESNMDGTVIELDSNKRAKKMILKKEQSPDFNYSNKYKTVNFYKFDAEYINSFFLKMIDQHIKSENLNSYYELIIEESIEHGIKFHVLEPEDTLWWEIDTIEDLQFARKMFSNSR